MRIIALTFLLIINLTCNGQSLTASLSSCYNLNGHTQDPISGLHGVITITATGPFTSPVPATTDRFNVANSALNLGGSAYSHIKFPDDPLLKPYNAITFAGWVRFSNFTLGINHLLFTRNNQSTNMEAYQLAVKSNSVGFYFNASKAGPLGVNTATGTTQLSNLTWYHVAFTIDSNSIKLYLNGVLEGSTVVTFPGFDYANGKKVILGGTDEIGNNVPCAAKVDNIRFYHRALTATEINLLYTSDPNCYSTPPPAPVCDDKTTYVITQSAIYYYNNINPSTASSPTVVHVVLPDSAVGLAVAPSFGFPAPNPTYWTIGKLKHLYYFDGNDFVSSGHHAGPGVADLGGSKNFLYGADHGNYKVYKYNGTGNAIFLNNIYTFPNANTTCDIVGDDADYFHIFSYGSPKAMGYYDPLGVPSFTAWTIWNLSTSASGGGFAINDADVITMFSNTIAIGVPNPTLNGLISFAQTPTALHLANDMASCYTKYSSSLTASGNGSLSCIAPQLTLTCNTKQYFPSFSWSGPSVISTSSNQAIVGLPGVYTCSITNGLNYTVHTYTILAGWDNTPLSISVTPTLGIYCSPNSLTLTATGANNYTWMPNTSISSTNTPQTNVNPSASIVYTVTGTTSGTCSATTTISVGTGVGPTVTASSSQATVCAFTTVTLSAFGATTYTWNGSLITPTLITTPGSTTIYTVVGSYTNGCTNTTTLVQNVVVCTDIEEKLLDSSIKIFPNPTKDLLYVDADLSLKELRYEFFNRNGVLVREGSIIQKKNIDLKGLTDGLYFMRIIYASGVYVAKIIIE